MVDDRGSNKSGWHVWPAWEEILPGHTLAELNYIEYVESPNGPALLGR